MKKLKEFYEDAKLEIVLLELSDIVTRSIEDEEDEREKVTPPSYGDWEINGWS